MSMRNPSVPALASLLLWLAFAVPARGAEPVTLHATDGGDVYATLTRAAPHNRRIILLFHQAHANRHEYDALVPTLTGLGFDTLAVDQRSGGDLFGGSNETVIRRGKSADYIDAMPDLQGTLQWAQARHYADIVAVGSSYTSALVIVLAARHPDAIDAVASFSPGEYYADKNMIKTAAAQVTVPFYITTDPEEEANVAEVLSKAHGTHITHYRPQAGVHGASTLIAARDPAGYRANLASFVAFLRGLPASATPPDGAQDAAMQGFTAAGASRQMALEKRFDAALDPADQRAWMQRMAAAPNQVGSPHDKANAEFMLQLFTSWGWDAHIERFDVLYPTPRTVALQMVAPTHFDAALRERPVPGDSSSGLPGGLPPYNVYGGDGDVTAELVYANYGMPDDYRELARRGIDVRGRIVLTRYGGGWRGLKPKLAQEHGAVGCLIYSDPRGDGYFQGDPYPRGGWRPADGVQRGSVMDMQQYPGDPLTPGIGSTAGARRLALKDAKTILTIPVLPISYADATPLLQALGGPVAPESWRGALPFTYHVGPGAARVHITVKSNWDTRPVYDVIAVMKGSTWPDQWIVRGNHHDGWVFGAWDPLAGNVALLDEAKAIGTLVKQGWRPRRTLVYASWDGEEPGLLGSTEWAETHAAELQRKAVLYVNSDTNGRGFLGAGGSHSLQHMLDQVANGVADPETGVSVGARRRARSLVHAYESNADEGRLQRLQDPATDVPIGALGAGSDYGAFLEHLGIASLDLGFGGEDDQGGVYHSRYDSFDHYMRFGDPHLAYGIALSRVAGHVVLRTADAQVLPLRFGDFSDTLQRYVEQLHKLVGQARKQTAQQHALLDMHAWSLSADPVRVVAAPERLSAVADVNLKPLDEAAQRLRQSVLNYRHAYRAFADRGLAMPDSRLAALNHLMGSMEQALTDPNGLPGRAWYRHMIYAPGLLTGYGVKTVPAVREAIEGRRWAEASRYAAITARVLDGYRTQLDRLTSMLGPTH